MKRPRSQRLIDGLLLTFAILLITPIVAIAVVPVLPVLVMAWPLVVVSAA